MIKYIKEIIILLLQVFMFYIFPLFAGPTDMMGLVLLLILSTLILSILLMIISDKRIKYSYPVIVSILFGPTILIYYNSSAVIHIIWYFIVSLIGAVIGLIINKLIKWRKEYEVKRTNN